MIKYSILILSSLCLFNIAVYAGPGSTGHTPANYKEEAGLGIGALIGGLIAGPPGAIIGAAGGAWYGKQEKTEDRKIAKLQQDLVKKQAELLALEQDLNDLQGLFAGKMRNVNAQSPGKSLEALSQGVSLSVYFRTNSTDIDPENIPRIQKLGNFIRNYPEIQVHLEAHADRRGTDNYNRSLSEKRAAQIRDYLVQSGLDENRIHPHAYGEREAMSALGDLEGYVFDRRVDIQLTLDTQI